MELGYGFCFIGRQHRLMLGKKEYFIDLLFYHRFLKALVAVELKVGSFEPEYAGKMDFYLNLLNDKERARGDNPSIGIILCAEKDDVVVEFSLKTKTNPIGVAEYHLTEKLPKELKGKLPSERQLLAAVKEAIEDKPDHARTRGIQNRPDRILTYAQDIGWTYVSRDEAERKLKTGQAGFCRTGEMRYIHRPGNQGENKGASDPG